MLESEPNFVRAHVDIGRTMEQVGMREEAIEHFKTALSLAGDNSGIMAALAYGLAQAGKRAEAEAMLEKMERQSRQLYVSPYYLAIAHLGLGQQELALDFLERSYEERFGYMVYLKLEPGFDSLRADPRFKDLLQRIGLSK